MRTVAVGQVLRSSDLNSWATTGCGRNRNHRSQFDLTLTVRSSLNLYSLEFIHIRIIADQRDYKSFAWTLLKSRFVDFDSVKINAGH